MDSADRLAIRLAIRAIDASLSAQLALAKERRTTEALRRLAERQTQSAHGALGLLPAAQPRSVNKAGLRSAYALATYL
jgi:hypothetical protein